MSFSPLRGAALLLTGLASAGCGGTPAGPPAFKPGPPWVECLAFSPDGQTLAVGQWTAVTLRDARTGEVRARLPEMNGSVKSVAFRRDGTRVAAGAASKDLKLFAPSGSALASLDGHRGPVAAVAFAPDGKTLVSSGANINPYDFVAELKLWDAETGKAVGELGGIKSPVFALTFLPDGTLVTGSYDGTVQVWDVAGRAARTSFDAKVGNITALALSADGKTLAAGGTGDGLTLWDTATWKEKAKLRGHGVRVTGLAFAPGGALASSSEDRTAILWDVAAGKETRTLSGHKGLALCVAYGADDATLVTGASDGVVRFWDAATGAERLAVGPPE